jgi:hypothetical protein
MPAAGATAQPVRAIGSVDEIEQSGNKFYLNGWACVPGSRASIDVALFAAGEPGKGGKFVGKYPANLASGADVVTKCQSTGRDYSFSIQLTGAIQASYGARPIYVEAIAPDGGDALLAKSGTLAVPQLIWFAPLFSFNSGANGLPAPYKQVDYMDLFAPDAPWTQARDHIKVFKLYEQFAVWGSDSDLETVFTYLKTNNLSLALEMGALTTSAQCGSGVEGYTSGPVSASYVATRVRLLGGDVKFVGMDEPLYYGHYYSGANGCQAPISTIARQAAATMQAVKAIFPDVLIGDIEPMDSVANADPSGNWLAITKLWIEGFKAEAGFPLAFFHDDATWSVPLGENVPRLQSLLGQEDIPFGMIYDGTDNAVSNSGWMSAAEEHIQAYNHSGNPQPEQVLFQTWNPYPTHALPETSPTAQTHLVDFYFSPQAQLSPDGDVSKDAIILTGGAVLYRSTCSLDALGAAKVNATNEVAYTYCLLQARAADPAGLAGWLAALSSGSITLEELMDDFYNSQEFQGKYSIAAMTNSEFVTFLYGLVLFHVPDANELAEFTAELNSGRSSRQDVFNQIILGEEFRSKNSILGSV